MTNTIIESADVHAHLANVANQARKAVLRDRSGSRIEGLLAPPDDEGRIAFRGASPTGAVTLEAGAAVQVEYRQAPGSCAFESQVVARGVSGNFILALPDVIRIKEHRKAERHRLRPTDRLGLSVMHHGRLFPVRVIDLSLTGLCFRFDPVRMNLGLGDVLQARVTKGRQAVEIAFEIRHLLSALGPSGMVQAGARYESLSLVELDQLLKLVKGSTRR